MHLVSLGDAFFEMLEGDGKKSTHNSLKRRLSSLPGVPSHERRLDFYTCAVLTVSRKTNLAHADTRLPVQVLVHVYTQ